MSKITEVKARQLIDCKCRPMVEVDVITEKGSLGRGSAPTGSSVGMYESFVLRDNDPKEYNGMSVHKAVENVNKIIAPALIGKEVSGQEEIDKIMIELDGTPDKHNLGGNAIYSASIAAFRAAAGDAGKTLYDYIAGEPVKDVPIPSFNVINGGKYPGLTQAFNEFIVMPYKADSIYEAVEIAVKVFQKLGPVIKNYTKKEPGVGGSYGWIAPSEDPEVLLSLMQEAIDACGYTGKCAFALDCASSEMYDAETKTYYLNGKRLSSDELIGYVKGLTERWNFVFIEDMLDENDWDGYEKAHREITRTLIIADDFTATSKERIARACSTNSIDGFILKPNQVGTISEALDAYRFARERGLLAIPSGRSGGVIGDVVMDLAVGLDVSFIKNGCPRSGERIDKLNFLMRVADLNPGCVMSDISSLVRF
ncbi:enolase [Cloacibacillus sp. An23]|uniref:phosphopyruvate hydratase n=1 Tax=Cloacibacillus sp. An23 TaxID=1965591 RepID=UPI000B392EC5|nr:enolase [Cloacibacillus sp. An23]OUO91154.1 enolase [Cloacibacillus sp. An23]